MLILKDKDIPPAQLLYMKMRESGFPCPHREYRFHPKRKWPFDFAWPDKMLAVEYQGGTYSDGAHVRGAGYERDREKINTATVMGWRVIEVTAKTLKSGQALKWIESALQSTRYKPST